MIKHELDKLWDDTAKQVISDLAEIGDSMPKKFKASDFGVKGVHTPGFGYIAETITILAPKYPNSETMVKQSRARITKGGEYQFESGDWAAPGATTRKLNKALKDLVDVVEYRAAVVKAEAKAGRGVMV